MRYENRLREVSPISVLIPDVMKSMERIAPERRAALDRETTDLVLIIEDHDAWVCCYSPGTREISVSTFTIEILWSFSLGHFVVYSMLNDMPSTQYSVSLDLRRPPRAERAMRLLRWAMRRMVSAQGGPWPDHTPRPIAIPREGSDEHAAAELGLGALAFLLHHELAHHRLRHAADVPPLLSIEQERDADYEAADWILGPTQQVGGAPADQRLLACTVGLGLMVGFGIHSGDHDGRTHPRDFDRLVNVVQRYARSDHDDAWAMALIVFKLHFHNKGIHVPDEDCRSVRECIDRYVERLASEP